MKLALEQALTELGIPRGVALMVHSDAMVVAQFAGMGNAAGISAFWAYLEQWLGGHLLVPTFREGANKRGNSSRLTQSFHFFMFEPIFSPVNALNQPI
ncbi:hypothetical protein Q7I26_13485, partial [Aeromonas veronii]